MHPASRADPWLALVRQGRLCRRRLSREQSRLTPAGTDLATTCRLPSLCWPAITCDLPRDSTTSVASPRADVRSGEEFELASLFVLATLSGDWKRAQERGRERRLAPVLLLVIRYTGSEQCCLVTQRIKLEQSISQSRMQAARLVMSMIVGIEPKGVQRLRLADEAKMEGRMVPGHQHCHAPARFRNLSPVALTPLETSQFWLALIIAIR